jgi:hypothetical protein
MKRVSEEFKRLGLENAELDVLLDGYDFLDPSAISRWVSALWNACRSGGAESESPPMRAAELLISQNNFKSSLHPISQVFSEIGMPEISEEIREKLKLLEEHI